jgi:myo-inositol catabolism protein IolC
MKGEIDAAAAVARMAGTYAKLIQAWQRIRSSTPHPSNRTSGPLRVA